MAASTLLTETPYCRISLNSELHALEFLWFANTEAMTNEEFREHLLLFANLAEEHHPRALYVHARQMGHAIASSTQEWHDEYIVPLYSRAGVEKMAFIQPESFFSRLAHEQTFDESHAQQLIETQFFTDEAEAEHWLQN
jgi:hypothetical protein